MRKSSAKQQQEVERVKPQREKVHQTLILDPAQRKRLQQQMQQDVQLLTQIHLLASSNPSLSLEASTTRIFLKELGTFAQSSIAFHHQFNPKFQTLFQPCNLMGAMKLIEAFSTQVSINWSPRKTVTKTGHLPFKDLKGEGAYRLPYLPKQVAWILAMSKVFMYPELLPVCSLKAKNPQDKNFFTKAEDSLLALSLKHFEGTHFPKPLISKIKNLIMNRAPDNIIKFYQKTQQLPILMKCCEEIQPVEREEHQLPFWLKASLPSIQEEMRRIADGAREVGNVTRTTEINSDPGLGKSNLELESETRFESPAALPATAAEARTSFPLPEPQTLLSSAPVPKLMLPSLAPSKFRKPCVKRRASKRKGPKASLCLKPAPLIRPAPVFFTVPATTVKAVSLGGGCSMVQPVSAAVAQSPQTIPITTLLVNPAPFPCSLNQPLVASSIPPLIVSGTSVNLSVPSTPEDKAPVNVDIGCPLTEGKNAFQGLEPKLEPREPSLCAAVFPKEEHSPGPPAIDRVCQEQLSESSAYGWTVMKTEEGRQVQEPLPQGFQESLNTSS
ncbi:hypothetical protein AB1E18_002611 [Capra hircus]